jgi:hypothetical protein
MDWVRNQKHAKAYEHPVGERHPSRTINVKKSDSSPSLIQGVFDDISGLFGFSSATNNNSSQHRKSMSSISKSSTNDDTASTESATTESVASTTVTAPSSPTATTPAPTTTDYSMSNYNNVDSWTIEPNNSGFSHSSKSAASKTRPSLFDAPFVTMKNLSCISPNDNNQNEGCDVAGEELKNYILYL